jgi:hypothetical protein
MRIVRSSTNNFIGNPLRSPLTLLKIWRTPVQLGGIDIFVEASFDPEELFVNRKLVPRDVAIGGRPEGIIIPQPTDTIIATAGHPSLQVAFATSIPFTLTDIGISAE